MEDEFEGMFYPTEKKKFTKSDSLKSLLFGDKRKKIESIPVEKELEVFSPAEVSNKQTLHRLNNKDKIQSLMNQKVFSIFGIYNKSFNESLEVGMLLIEKKPTFDFSIIISNDKTFKRWFLLNLTNREINALYRNLKLPFFDSELIQINEKLKLFYLVQNHFETIISFKNAIKQYNAMPFIYDWIADINEEIIKTEKINQIADDAILLHT